jgi:hypothetical protein
LRKRLGSLNGFISTVALLRGIIQLEDGHRGSLSRLTFGETILLAIDRDPIDPTKD